MLYSATDYQMPLTLYELNNLVRRVIDSQMTDQYWVTAELSEARQSAGHCYMELIQKDEEQNTPIARASAKCWRSTWSRLLPKFLDTAGTAPRQGMQVMLRVYPQFHEAYGFSWIVTDIDPTYTLGDMARRRQQIVSQLKEEGVFDLNRQLPLPLFCQRIAVISSQTAAGWGDFRRQLIGNAYRLRFRMELFPAVMQGESVEESVIQALNAVNDRIDDFDCVVIIRGGGAASDLSGFDSLLLAENIANFPLPVITGIGHERDETVADMVAHTKVKTPTAAAALLIDNLRGVSDRLLNAERQISDCVARRLQTERQIIDRLRKIIPTLFQLATERQRKRLDRLSLTLSAAARTMIERQRNRLAMTAGRLPSAALRLADEKRHRLSILAQRAEMLDPQLLLARGYSMTTLNGRIVTSADELRPGDVIETRLRQGKVRSRVINDE